MDYCMSHRPCRFLHATRIKNFVRYRVLEGRRRSSAASTGEKALLLQSGGKPHRNGERNGLLHTFVEIIKAHGLTGWCCKMCSVTSFLPLSCRSLPQAGDGENFTEGCNNSIIICYKCGGRNHWARDCSLWKQDNGTEVRICFALQVLI